MVGSLDVNPPAQLTSLLAEKFGFTDFLPGQREVIGHLVAPCRWHRRYLEVDRWSAPALVGQSRPADATPAGFCC